MSSIQSFEFSPFSENTYVIWDETNECVIIDPGCFNSDEHHTLKSFIEEKNLKPVRLLLTHAHLDHIFGCKFVADTWGLKVEGHKGEVVVLDAAPAHAKMYGISLVPSPAMEVFHEEGDRISFGNTTFKVLFTPGHSPASICFYNEAEHYVICGDTIFQSSIGRTDLPGGNLETLMTNIIDKLLVLPDQTRLLPGHNSETTVGIEKQRNPFIQDWQSGKRI
ncbi:MAG: hydroxyacylglutathione hydrolase [Limisphaerales bacterium]|jgi:hydroxyacylglutathione hydrolase